jgi:hypothetical protein
MYHRRKPLVFIFILAIFSLMSCGSDDEPLTTNSLEPVAANRNLQIVTGQTIYVPAYSEVFSGREGDTIDLAVTLAIHNTDLDSPIIIKSVRYYDTDGNLVREYVPDSVELPPLATTGFLVEDGDSTGGWGANFIVEWVAEEPVYEPVIEAIMITTRSAQGISFVSTGRIISQIVPDDPDITNEE